jgi:molybdopterin-containing oxidoreductase family iron-sulfur binding subunit
VIANLQLPVASTFDEQWLSGVASDLMAKPGASLVLAGPNQPGEVHLLAYAINAALLNLGQTLVVRQVPRNPRTIGISQLAADINDGRIKQLFILGGDPVYNAPRGLVEDQQTGQPLDWSDLQKKVPEIVRLGYHEDSTSALSQWHIPAAHYLESWGTRSRPTANICRSNQ